MFNDRSSGLADGVTTVTKSLLSRVQLEEERNFRFGHYLNPCAIRYDGKVLDEKESYRSSTFLNFPYFSLERRPSHPPVIANDPAYRSYPTRTLLQSRYRLEDTLKRDGEQAVTKLSAHETEDCIRPAKTSFSTRKLSLSRRRNDHARILCIPQFWCLSVSGGSFSFFSIMMPVCLTEIKKSCSLAHRLPRMNCTGLQS